MILHCVQLDSDLKLTIDKVMCVSILMFWIFLIWLTNWKTAFVYHICTLFAWNESCFFWETKPCRKHRNTYWYIRTLLVSDEWDNYLKFSDMIYWYDLWPKWLISNRYIWGYNQPIWVSCTNANFNLFSWLNVRCVNTCF